MKLLLAFFLTLLVGIATCNGFENKNEDIHVQHIKAKISHLQGLLDNKQYDIVDSHVHDSLTSNGSGTDFELTIKLKLNHDHEKEKKATEEEFEYELNPLVDMLFDTLVGFSFSCTISY